ncbi:MAG TPA: membrane protein insertase YidC, partial [Brevundimonas sp.]|nr:membrane protein insertase YidC [Brevundimonas sp.]
MQNQNSRNTIIFFVCAALIMGVYYFMVMRPQAEARRQAQVVAAEQQKAREASPDAGLTASSAVPGFFIKDRGLSLGAV